MRHPLVRIAIGVAGAGLLAGGTIAVVPARAMTNSVTACGTTITTSGTYTVMADIGPCTSDGIVIKANAVTLNLNGHTLTGSDTTNATANEQVGVVIRKVTSVTVNGPGTVTAFDAGVDVQGGSGNTVQNVTVHDNIAHVLLTGGVGGMGDPTTNPCNFGDGILTDGSKFNTIAGNTSYHNGPFSGIALVGASHGNVVSGNNTHDQTVSNVLVAGTPGAGLTGPCGPFGANIIGRGRLHQDTGIRVEGPGAANNQVTGNMSTGNQLEGIAIHSHICNTSSSLGGPSPTPDNEGNLIANNTVSGNGAADGTDGIAILEQGPTGIVCPSSHETITGNTSTGNARDGIFMGGRGSNGNVVTNNTLNTNGKDGIELGGPEVSNGVTYPGSINNTITGNTASGNPHFDAEDHNPGCDNNSWSGNTFGTVSQTCIH